jgi:hypothetical protein
LAKKINRSSRQMKKTQTTTSNLFKTALSHGKRRRQHPANTPLSSSFQRKRGNRFFLKIVFFLFQPSPTQETNRLSS